MANCVLKDDAIDIIGLTLQVAHQIKIALIHFSIKNLPSTYEERNFNAEIVTSPDKVLDSMCHPLLPEGSILI